MSDTEPLLELLSSELKPLVIRPEELTEFVLDLGRPFEVRYGLQFQLFDDYIIDKDAIEHALSMLGSFGPDNRAGIDRTLHRISRIVTRTGEVVGLTCRAGRPVPGSVNLIQRYFGEGLNVLLLGPPGSGKTTKLREAARLLSETKRVVIVDTSNEIAGEGQIPHAAVGRSRRLQVPSGRTQRDVMIEAVENHNPEVIIIDEISTVEEAEAARTIAQRGVQLVATAHGRELHDFINNPPLCELIGGVNTVTLSDDTAMRDNGGKKTLIERKTAPTFPVVVEIVSFDEVRVHPLVAEAVDALLKGGVARPERWIETSGEPLLATPSRICPPSYLCPPFYDRVDEEVSKNGRVHKNGKAKTNGQLVPKKSTSRTKRH